MVIGGLCFFDFTRIQATTTTRAIITMRITKTLLPTTAATSVPLSDEDASVYRVTKDKYFHTNIAGIIEPPLTARVVYILLFTS